MGFDDLEAAEREHGEREGDDEQADDASRADGAADSPTPAESQSTEAASTSSAGASGRDEGSVADEPAFEFGDVKQSPMYARPEAWAALEDALDLEVVRALREAGIRTEEKRELHDAALRVAAAHPEEIADAVREARREE